MSNAATNKTNAEKMNEGSAVTEKDPNETTDTKIQFFGAIDRDKITGKIMSDYPAQTFPRQIEMLEETIASKKRNLEMGVIPDDNKGEYNILLEREEKQLETIKASIPKLTNKQKDHCAGIYKNLTKVVGDSMPSYNKMHKNFIDPHRENKLNTRLMLKVSPEAAQLASDNGIKVSKDCEMSRNGASKLAKIIGHHIGEETNMETLRRDN